MGQSNGNSNEFYQQLLKKEQHTALTAEEIQSAQAEWSSLSPEQPARPSKFPTYFFAGFWIRLGAFVIDLLCIKCIVSATVGILVRAAIIPETTSLLSVYGFISFFIYYAYFILLTKLNHGQTIGKMIFGIRVVALKETKLTWQTVLIREGAGRMIVSYPFFGLLGYLPIIFTKNKQQVADMFSDTGVVSLTTLAAFQHQPVSMDPHEANSFIGAENRV